MDTSSILTTLLPTLAGPASAVIVLMLVLFAVYNLTIKYVLPLVESLAMRHLKQIDDLVTRQTETTEAFKHLLQRIEEHLEVTANAAAGQSSQMEVLREIHGVLLEARAILHEIRTVQAEIRSDVDRLTREEK